MEWLVPMHTHLHIHEFISLSHLLSLTSCLSSHIVHKCTDPITFHPPFDSV